MNFKTKILIIGMVIITLISIVAASLLNCKIYGVYIVFFDILSTIMCILVGNYVINSYLAKNPIYKKNFSK